MIRNSECLFTGTGISTRYPKIAGLRLGVNIDDQLGLGSARHRKNMRVRVRVRTFANCDHAMADRNSKFTRP